MKLLSDKLLPIALGGSLLVMASANLHAASVDSVLAVGEEKTKIAVKSQGKIDSVAEQTEKLLQDYKKVNKQIDGLRVYNGQLERQIQKQNDILTELANSIEQVTVMERQIPPLTLRMLDALDQFVALDVPFHDEKRKEGLEKLRDNLDDAKISKAEKFRQVLEAYKIESEYGRKIDTYKDTIAIDGQDREVNVLRVGRIALMYQTTDTELSGAWDQRQRKWVSLDPSVYRSSILKGIRIAKKQASIDIMKLPILAPEAAQ